MYIKSNANNELVDSNYSPKRLRQDYPNTSFPRVMTDEQLAEYYIYPVTEVVQPLGDVVTKGAITLINGNWLETWSVRDYTSEETGAKTEELKSGIVQMVQRRLDGTALAHGYDSMLSVCSYTSSSVPRYKLEADYCVSLRDATWLKLEAILREILSGTRPMPTGFDDIAADLPEVVWP